MLSTAVWVSTASSTVNRLTESTSHRTGSSTKPKRGKGPRDLTGGATAVSLTGVVTSATTPLVSVPPSAVNFGSSAEASSR
ncbi:MAG TPA: hypothetical protein VMU16_11620 [Candidatus Binataceae bacterium]|nr:hypothetical protein [Candidatus Binataceae bacterium]